MPIPFAGVRVRVSRNPGRDRPARLMPLESECSAWPASISPIGFGSSTRATARFVWNGAGEGFALIRWSPWNPMMLYC